MERTLFIIKPDAVQRGLVGEIVKRLEARGLKIVGLKMTQVGEPLVRRHYGEHESKPFFAGLIAYITAAPVILAVWEGPRAAAVARQTAGVPSRPFDEIPPGTIRADLALETGRNVVHISDSIESAVREVALFFRPEEILSYGRDTDRWVYEEG